MIENDEERRSRDKFVRERDYGGPDNRFPRRDFGGPDRFETILFRFYATNNESNCRFRRDYNGVGGIKRTVIRRDNDGEMKRGRLLVFVVCG